MFEPLRQLFRPRQVQSLPSIPPGERAYVVGDIHGRLDLFDALIHAIDRDEAESAPPGKSIVVLLGDLVDRGPESAQVVARAREWQARRPVRILAGNHEEMFLEAFEDRAILRHFLKHGGRETILSYGVTAQQFNEASLEELQQLMHHAVPRHDRDFLAGFEDYIEMGDYLFVHAGIAPDVPLEEQQRRDMLWIREPFLRHTEPHSHVVVHGHTIFDEIDTRPNRIGVDTGAFRTGKLTALVLEGQSKRTIQAVRDAAGIAIHKKECEG
jgi:serine/threonine protein phosphatase 1